MRITKSVSSDYMWSKDWFFVYTETEETSKCTYLKAEMDVGDNVDDEWMVACILMEVSKQIGNVAVILSLSTNVRSKCRTRTAIFSSSRRHNYFPTGWIPK